METAPILAWTLVQECSIPDDVTALLVDGEQAVAAYKTFRWSSENAGGFLDMNAELELWTRAGHIKVNLQKGIDIRKLDRLIAEAVIGNLS